MEEEKEQKRTKRDRIKKLLVRRVMVRTAMSLLISNPITLMVIFFIFLFFIVLITILGDSDDYSTSTPKGPIEEQSIPPTADNCNGKYSLNNPLGANFGDPQCDYTPDDLYRLLQQQDPEFAYHWYAVVVECESTYIPNAFNGNAVDPAGAWGLFQMGRGRNGPLDRGDVQWQTQISNAILYSKRLLANGKVQRCYWHCWGGPYPDVCR